MAIRLGDEAPDFTAETTEGTVRLHDYPGESWGLLFSHPKDFTPVCTTELGALAKRKPEFEQRNVNYPQRTGRNIDELLRVIDTLQLTAATASPRPSTGRTATTPSSCPP
jgi:alkyl hydroperoxide reductase subunit AhpC